MLFGKYIKKENLIREISMSLASYCDQLDKACKEEGVLAEHKRTMLSGRIDGLVELARDFDISDEVERWRKIYLSRLRSFGRLG